MANVLGTLLVELGVNTVSFLNGVSKATYAAKQGAQAIASSLSSIGSKVTEIGAQFGVFGTAVGQSIGTVGRGIATLLHEAGDMSGVAGYLKLGTIGFGALAVGATTAAAAVVGIAVHASEAAARLYDLSQATGTSVKDLSGLGIVGQLVGVGIDSLGRALERMSRTALAASLSPQALTNGYRTLGISVTDSAGKLKPVTELFGEVADKFSNMADGATKTALAIQIFGRAGAEMIPILNQGRAAIQYWVDYGTKVGAVLDTEAAHGAKSFQDELTKLNLISTGVQNQLMIELLPALDHITASFGSLAQRGNLIAQFGDLVGRSLVFITERVYDVADAWNWWSSHIDVWQAKWEKFTNWLTAGPAGQKGRADWNKLHPDDVTKSDAELDKIIKDAQDRYQKASDELAVARGKLEFKGIMPPAPEAKRGSEPVPTPSKPIKATGLKEEKDYVGELVDKTNLATAAEVARTAAIGESSAALLLNKANEDAIQKIGETRITVQERLRQLQVEGASAEAEEAAGVLGAKQKVAGIQKLEAELQHQLVTLDQSKQKLIALYDTKEVASFAVATGEAFQKSNEELQQSVNDAKQMVDAVQKGGQAIVDVQIDQKLEKDRQKIDELRQAYNLLANTEGVDVNQLAVLAQSIDSASAAVDKHKSLLLQEHDLTVRTQEAHFNLTATYRTEIDTLQEQMNVAKQNNDVIAQALITIQERKAWTDFQTQVNAATMQIGTFGERVAAMFNQVGLDSQTMGQNIFKEFLKSIGNVNQQLAQMVVTGKANFVSLLQSFAEMLAEMSIKQAEAGLASGILKTVFGIFTSGIGAGGTSGFTPSFSDVGTSDIAASLSSLPHLAAGGDVLPGSAYMVGEQGPELFMPSSPGSIVSNSKIGGSSVTYQIDARGAAPGVEDRIVRAIKMAEDRAVARSVSSVQNLQARRP